MNSNKSGTLGPDLVVQEYGIDRTCGRPAPWVRPLMWITTMGNHGVAGGISERRRSSFSSYNYWCSIMKHHAYDTHFKSIHYPKIDFFSGICILNLLFYYAPHTMKLLGGYNGFTPSIHPASSVRSVASIVLVGSISYLYISSNNFRRCVACQVKWFGIPKKITKWYGTHILRLPSLIAKFTGPIWGRAPYWPHEY